MAITIRKSNERKFFDHGWLKTYHTFSFASYYDPNFMGFRNLRVINEDRVAPGKGFGEHPHRDMEIISLVLDGELAHKDSMGNETILHANEMQTMSAGTGITHSEYNPSQTKPVHFLQIWIEPEATHLKPRYHQEKKLPDEPNQWVLLVSKDGRNKSLTIHQDVNIYSLTLQEGRSQEIDLARYGWVQMLQGDLALNGQELHQGDGAAIDSPTKLKLSAKIESRLLLFDLA